MNIFTRFFLFIADNVKTDITAIRFVSLAIVFDNSLSRETRLSALEDFFSVEIIDHSDIPF